MEIQAAMQKKMKAAAIRELPQNSSLYVLNTSDLNSRQPRNELLFTVVMNNGQERAITIPRTWVPIDITSAAPLDSIRDAREFWDLIDKGYLIPIDRDVAEELLDDDEAKEELRMIYGRKDDQHATNTPDNADAIGYIPKTGDPRVDNFIATMQKNTARVSNAPQANPKVFSIIKNAQLSESQKLSALKNMEMELGQPDYMFILTNADMSDTRLKDWAMKKSK